MTDDIKYPEEIRQDEMLRRLDKLEESIKSMSTAKGSAKHTYCGDEIKPDRWNDVSDNQVKAERELPKKEVETFVYVVGKDGTPLRLVTFNKALTVGEVNELVKQASGERAFTLGGDPDKPFCDLCKE